MSRNKAQFRIALIAATAGVAAIAAMATPAVADNGHYKHNNSAYWRGHDRGRSSFYFYTGPRYYEPYYAPPPAYYVPPQVYYPPPPPPYYEPAYPRPSVGFSIRIN